MSRIQLTDSLTDVAVKMCDGNPGAIRVVCELLKEGAAIDPDCAMGGLMHVMDLDTLGIYGSKIWMLYADVCNHDLPTLIAVLRSWQLGMLSESAVKAAIEDYGKGLDLDKLLPKVREQLPRLRVNSREKNRMTPAEIIATARDGHLHLTTWPDHLRYLSRCVLDAQLSDGRRVLDASDCRVFLEELADEAEKGMI